VNQPIVEYHDFGGHFIVDQVCVQLRLFYFLNYLCLVYIFQYEINFILCWI